MEEGARDEVPHLRDVVRVLDKLLIQRQYIVVDSTDIIHCPQGRGGDLEAHPVA